MGLTFAALRTALYWFALVFVAYGCFRALSIFWPEMSFGQMHVSFAIAETPFSVFRDKNFALALSGLIGAAAFGFGAAHFVSTFIIRFSFYLNRKGLSR
jgi:hypothetical protein